MPIDPSKLMTASLRSNPCGKKVSRILTAALRSVEPGKAVERYLVREGELLKVEGKSYDLQRYQRILLVGAGKAGAPMAEAVARILGSYLTQGIVIVKEGYAGLAPGKLPPNVEIIEAGHPIPDERGLQGTEKIVQMLRGATRRDLIINVISGGGSALLSAPAGGLELRDLQGLTSALLERGATINEINSIRKHLDLVKGGGLARLSDDADKITLVLSDVVGDPLDVIASGPTVPDPSTYSDAYTVLEQFDLLETVPQPILSHLHQGMTGALAETPKKDDPLFNKVQNVVVGSNLQAACAALAQAEQEGFHAMLLTTYLEGEARYAGRLLASIARQIDLTDCPPIERPACIISGGETTVTLTGFGLGGRNQELALGAVNELAGLRNIAMVTLATDGGDGPTDAAGAVVTGETLERARTLGLNPKKYLARNDAYRFFDELDDLLKTGPTQTNVNDLTFLFAF